MSKIRILISRPDRIGDVVLSTPLPREIKKQYPNSHVALLLRKYTSDIYENNPFVDQIIIADKFTIFGLVNEIRRFHFTHSFMLLPTEKINWILFFSGIKKRFGVGHKFYQFITNTKSVYRNKYIPLRHEADYCLDFAGKLGIKSIDLSSEIYLTEEEKKLRQKIKAELSPHGEILIGINSTSGNSAPNIPPSEYRILAEMILNNHNFRLVITDLNPPEELKGIGSAIYININQKLRDSIVHFSTLDILISASTGPMHIAAALNVKTLSLFCPLPACSPQLWGPQGNESYVLLPEDNYCQVVCSGNPKTCMFQGSGGINAEKIFKKLLTIL